MEINFDVAFAENGSKSDISEDKWLLGWVEIVGGINGVPTAQQFNQFGYVFDRKANIAYSKANEAMAGLDNHSNDSTLHISATERENWNSKADKSYVDAQLEGKADTTYVNKNLDNKANKSDIPTSLPANGGNAATVNWHSVNSDVPANAKFTDTTYSNMTAATASAAGKAGLVPAPAAGKQASYLRGDGTWAVPTNTTYSPGTGISISGTTISNSGVRSVATGESNGTISVNTNGTAANVAVKGLASAAYQAVQTAAGTVGLHRISSGTAAATTTNCPAGCWYGQYE